MGGMSSFRCEWGESGGAMLGGSCLSPFAPLGGDGEGVVAGDCDDGVGGPSWVVGDEGR